MSATTIVLDTNAVMDWLVFDDPAMRPIAEAIASGRAQWLSSDAMRAELTHVLERGVASTWRPDVPAILDTVARCSMCLAQPSPNATAPALRCTDTDDQKFIDFAVAHRAQWLITRDRALLKLHKRARLHGLAIVMPTHWKPSAP